MRRYDLYKKLEQSLFPVYYREIIATNNESSSLTNYQICIEIDDSSFLNKANPNKLLLVLSDNTVLPYWVEEWKHPSGKARIWTKIDLPASGKVQVRLFYGLSFDIEQDGDSVFVFFDDFDGNNLNATKWEKTDLTGVNFNISDSHANVDGTASAQGYFHLDSKYAVTGSVEAISSCRAITVDHGGNYEIKIFVPGEDSWVITAFTSESNKNQWRKFGRKSGVDYTTYLVDRTVEYTKIKLRRFGSNIYSFYYDGLSWKELGSVYTEFPTSDVKLVLGVWYYESYYQKGYFDWVFVRKFTNNEPSIEVGEEQKVLSGVRSNRIYISSKFSDYTKYMREITITNNSSSDLSNYQIYLELGGDFQYKANKNSLVITDSNGTILPYWVEDFGIGGKVKIWIPITLSGSATDKWYLYYGGFVDNPPNGDNVFLFFDDFDGDSLNTSKWTYSNNGTLTVANSFVKLETGTTSNTYVAISRVETFSTPIAFSIRKFCGAYSGTSNDRGATFYTYDSTGDNSLHCTLFRYGHNYRIDHEVSGTWQGSTTLEDEMKINTIYKIDCIFDGSSVKIDLKNDNDLLIATHTYSSFTFDPANIRLESYNKASSINCEGDFDWIYIRKYISSSPTISVGNEIEYYKVW